ncbi:MAG: DNA-formamidopyrimidine glycosylase family protein [Dehalococcoidia bacterium]
MPEAPDLVVVREFLLTRLVGDTIVKVTERKPLVLRNMTGADFESDLAGRRVESLERQGKLLIVGLSSASGDRELIISPMLTGALMWCDPGTRMMASTVFVFDMKSGQQLRYIDQKRMGQVYYLSPHQRSEIVRLENQGPDVIDERLSFDDFKDGLRSFRGEVKGVLTRGKLVSGIGNAYADEILHDAMIYPFKKVTRLSEEEKKALHRSVYSVPESAVKVLRERVGTQIHRKIRDFLKVHGKKNEKCPRCGSNVTMITANKRETSYCRTCQPGSLFDR